MTQRMSDEVVDELRRLISGGMTVCDAANKTGYSAKAVSWRNRKMLAAGLEPIYTPKRTVESRLRQSASIKRIAKKEALVLTSKYADSYMAQKKAKFD